MNISKRFGGAALAAAVLCSVSGSLAAQEKASGPAKKIAIRAGRLIDGKSDTPVANALIIVEGDRIVSVTAGGAPPAGVELIDLSKRPSFPDLQTFTRTCCCRAM